LMSINETIKQPNYGFILAIVLRRFYLISR
jgi:hypothetical protein